MAYISVYSKFIKDGLAYAQNLPDYVQSSNQNLSNIPMYFRRKYDQPGYALMDSFLDPSFIPDALRPLSGVYRYYRDNDHQPGKDIRIALQGFLSTNFDEFFNNSQPNWNILFDDLIENGQVRVAVGLAHQEEVFSTLSKNDQKALSVLELVPSHLIRNSHRWKDYERNEAIDDMTRFILSNRDQFSQEPIKWSILLGHLANNSKFDVVESFLKDQEFLNLLSEPQKQFWVALSRSSSSLRDVFLTNLDFTKEVDQTTIEKLQNASKVWNVVEKLPPNVRAEFIGNLDFTGELDQKIIEKIQKVSEVYQKIQLSSSKEMRKFSAQIAAQIFQAEDIDEAYDKVNSVFVLNNLPEIGKIYRVFEILHPQGEINSKIADRKVDKHGSAQLSPILVEASPRRRYDIIYRDLLKVHIDSANPSLYRYLKTLQEGQSLIDKVELQGIGAINPDTELLQLTRFLNRMDMLYANSLYGRRANVDAMRTPDLQTRIQALRQAFGIPQGQSFTDRIAQMFARPVGYESLDQVVQHMGEVKLQAHKRNIDFYNQAVRGNDGKLKIQPGDLIKGVRENYLELFFQNGAVAKEYLGAAANSDNTPFDTDVSRVLPEHITDEYGDVVNQSLVKNYGDLVFVFRNRGEFQETKPQNRDKYDPTRYELFYSGYHGQRHWGIRTGIASTEIDAMIVQGNLEKDQAGQARIFSDIAQVGFYIPVVNKEGSILFTPQDFERYRLKKDELSALFNESNFLPLNLIHAYEKSPFLNLLFKSSSGVHEGYNLEQHTSMVMNQFERYFADSWSSPLLNKNQFRILLSLHDLGKPLAVQKTGSTKEQHEYTLKFVGPLLENMGFGQRETEIVTAVVDQDFLGDYLKGNQTAEQTATGIKNKAAELGVPVKDLMTLLRAFYISDAGSYTIDAGGKASLDGLFNFNREPNSNKGEVRFSGDVQIRYTQLLQNVYQT